MQNRLDLYLVWSKSYAHSSAQTLRQERSDDELWINRRKYQRGLLKFGYSTQVHGPSYILEMFRRMTSRTLYSMLGMGEYRHHVSLTDNSSAMSRQDFNIWYYLSTLFRGIVAQTNSASLYTTNSFREYHAYRRDLSQIYFDTYLGFPLLLHSSAQASSDK